MDSFYQVIAVGGAALVVASGLWTAVRLHGERPFSTLGTLLAGVAPVISLVIYAATLDVGIKQGYTWGLLAGGAVVGVLLGMAIPIYARVPEVLTRAAGWHLLLPWLAVAAIQVMGVRESFEGIVLSLAALYASTAFTAAASTVVLVRGLTIRAGPIPASGVPAAVVAGGATQCGSCGSPVRAGWRYCMTCGAQL